MAPLCYVRDDPLSPAGGKDSPVEDKPTSTSGCGGSIGGMWVVLLGLGFAGALKLRRRKEN